MTERTNRLLYQRLIEFLEDKPALSGPASRRTALRAAGFHHLASQIVWEGSARDFTAGLIGVIAEQGQDALTRFLKEGLPNVMLTGANSLSPEDQAALDELAGAVAGLNPAEWQAHLLGQVRTAPFMARDLPENFVARPAELRLVKDQLITRKAENASGPEEFELLPGAVAGLHGFGGFGKTIMALAICHDPQVRQACPDGILWVTLGREPGDLVAKINELCYFLSRAPHNFISLEAARAELRRLLEDRRMLIVVDDIWDENSADPFMEGGPGCARLLTARSISALPIQAFLIDIGAMQVGEASALLGAGLPHTGYTRELEDLADRLGQWPILLQLVNSALSFRLRMKKRGLEDALAFVNESLTRWGLNFMNAGQKLTLDQAVTATVETSLEQLPVESRARYTELAIFPEDQWIPLQAIELLWNAAGGLDSYETENLVTILYDLALLQDYDSQHDAIRIHDVMRDYLYQRLASRTEKHLRLVGLWGEPPRAANPYAWRWFAYHLARAAQSSPQPLRHELTKRLIKQVCNPEFQDRHKTVVQDLPALQADLELALNSAVADDHPQALPLVVHSARAIVAARRRFLRPAHIFSVARQGQIEAAVQQARLFHLDQNWHAVLLLAAAWLAHESSPTGTRDLRDRVKAEAPDDPLLDTLFAWIDSDLLGTPAPQPAPGPPPVQELVRALLDRIGGQSFDSELILSVGIPIISGDTGTLGMGEFAVATAASGGQPSTTAYLAEQDWPHLLAYAAGDPTNGMAVLDEYLAVFSNYSYPEYRYKSLWIVLSYAVQHPQKAWVKEALEKICLAALSGSSVEFEEGLGIAVQAARIFAGNGAQPDASGAQPDASGTQSDASGAQSDASGATPEKVLHEYGSRVVAQVEQQLNSQPAPGKEPHFGDSWGYQLRRLTALAQAEGWLLGHIGPARELLETGLRLKDSGKAGFRVMADLALAEAIEVCAPHEMGWISQALDAARLGAHNVQDTHFCARMTGRVNAMQHNWWPVINPSAAAAGLAHHPRSPEYAALHITGWMYPGRKPSALPFKAEHLYSNQLVHLAELYNRPLEDFLRLNRDQPWLADTVIQADTPVRVPDPGLVPLLAARFSAAILTDLMLTDADRCRAIMEMVPAAVLSPTALDAVLARLVLAWARSSDPPDPEVLAELAAQAPLLEQAIPADPQGRAVTVSPYTNLPD